MNLNIQTVHFDADVKLKNHIEQKIQKLNQFHDQIINVNNVKIGQKTLLIF